MNIVKLKALPKWVPDAASSSCLICKIEWGFFYPRKHHCRVCGQIFCDDCSLSRFNLSLGGTEPQRVCDLCAKAIRTIRSTEEIEELDDHLAQISQYIHIDVKTTTTTTNDTTTPSTTSSSTTETSTSKPSQQQQQPQQQQQQEQSVTLDDFDNDEQIENDGSVVVGSVQSVTSVVNNDSTNDSTTNTTNNINSQSSSFMSDLINTPDVPQPEPQQPQQQQQESKPLQTKPQSPQIAQLSVTITQDSTTNSTTTTPKESSSSSSLLPTSTSSVTVNIDPCETPSGKKAQQRAQYGSLKRSINRPTQHGTQPATLSSQGANKLRTLKRNQLEGLIKQAQVAAVVQELDVKKQGTSTDDLDVSSLLIAPKELQISTDDDNITNINNNDPGVMLSPTSQLITSPTPSSTENKKIAAIDEDNVTRNNDDNTTTPTATTTTDETSITTEQPSPSSSTSSTARYPTHNITQSGRYTIVDLFNCLWSKNPPLIIDTRDIIRYNISHVPFAIHLPILSSDIDFEKNELITPLSALTSRIPTVSDQRAWRMRKGRSIVIVGQGPDDQDITAKSTVDIEALLQGRPATINNNNDDDSTTTKLSPSLSSPTPPNAVPEVEHIMNEYDTIPHFVPALIASACIKENIASAVDIVSFGAQSFIDRYPFLVCSSMNARHATLSLPKLEENDTKHNHIPRFPAFPNEIIDQCVYLGSQADSEQRGQLEKLGITHIINATADLANPFENETIQLTDQITHEVIQQPLFRYLRLSMNDTQDQPLLEQLNHAFEFIDNALAGETLAGLNTIPGTPGKVLVHCQMGISRSASIIVAYVMRSYRCDLYHALAMVKSRRQQVLPNPQFILELSRYECLLFGYNLEQSSYQKCIDELYPNGIPPPK